LTEFVYFSRSTETGSFAAEAADYLCPCLD